VQGAGFEPIVKDACGGQKFGKVDDLSVGRGLRPMVPANVHASAHGLHRYKLFTGLRGGRFYALDNFTHWVSLPKTRKAPPVLGLRGLWLRQLRFLG
jgi:hypothetical protein